MEKQMVNELPDLFRFENGEASADAWRRRQQDCSTWWLVSSMRMPYCPPDPGELLHAHRVKAALETRLPIPAPPAPTAPSPLSWT